MSLHLADAVRLDFADLAPAPTEVVANLLPYGVAATVLLKSIAELPQASLWVAMVQREVGDRLAAAARGKLYGVTRSWRSSHARSASCAACRAASFTRGRTWSRR